MAEKNSKDNDIEDDINNFHIHTTYATVTIKLSQDNDLIKYLHNKYTILIKILLQDGKEIRMNPYDPKHDLVNTKRVRAAKDLPNKMTAIQKYITVTAHCPNPDHNASIWANIFISPDSEFEDIMNLTSSDFESIDINIMYKCIQSHKSSTPVYFHFICNQSDPDDIYKQIILDIGEIWNWVLFSKVT